ncbi:MAG: S9 family peptidase [Chlamydiales bacterium]
MIEAPYGTWESPVSAEIVVEKALRLGNVVADGSTIYWTEGRPEEKGRNALMRYKSGKSEEILTNINVRTRVHEYGGGPYTVKENHVVFVDDKTQSLYLYQDGKILPLTPTDNRRYAEPVIDLERKTVYAICEEHGEKVENFIVAVDLNGKKPPEKIISGDDFYSTIRLRPDGKSFAYLAWNHPNLPWDATELRLHTIGESEKKIAGGDSSISLPAWGPDEKLYYSDDRGGFWSLFCYDGNSTEPLTTDIKGDFGEPQWVFGSSRLAFDNELLLTIYTQKGEDHLATFDLKTKKCVPVDLPFTSFSGLQKGAGCYTFIAAGPKNPAALYTYDLKELKLIRESKKNPLPENTLSLPQAITFPTYDGKEAYAFYYPPKNANYKAAPGEKPPLIVRCHGGPTSHTPAVFSLVTQFWTTRGFAVVDVNYGGSTGYGREYRKRLNGNWGIVDVQDAISAAKFLVKENLADENRLAIRGGSAGGYTTLAALTFENYFQAGCSLYGICDLELLDQSGHKFEHCYNHNLIGPYPEKKALYRERSPIHRIDELTTPLLILQGDEDKIVPPDQAEAIAKALDKSGTSYEYILFPGEQHGFRKSESVIRALNAELAFYKKTFSIN